jgi:hypothetical protein
VDQADLLRHAIDVLETHEISYMVVGSFASAVYGEPRLTHDIDIVVDLRMGQVEPLCAAFPSPEFYVSVDAAREAAASGGQFNVIHSASGNKIDFLSPRADAWGQRQLTRRIRKPILPDCEAFTASPEDVILGKLWYYQEGGSEKHLRDVAAVLQVSGDQIDRAYVDRWATELGLTEPWRAVVERLE